MDILLWLLITSDELFIYRSTPIILYGLNIFSYHFLSSHYRYCTIAVSNKSSTPPPQPHNVYMDVPEPESFLKTLNRVYVIPWASDFFFSFFHWGFFVVLDFIGHFFFNANLVRVPLIRICHCRFYGIWNAHTHIMIFCFLFIFIISSLAHYILSSPYSRLPIEGCST